MNIIRHKRMQHGRNSGHSMLTPVHDLQCIKLLLDYETQNLLKVISFYQHSQHQLFPSPPPIGLCEGKGAQRARVGWLAHRLCAP